MGTGGGGIDVEVIGRPLSPPLRDWVSPRDEYYSPRSQRQRRLSERQCAEMLRRRSSLASARRKNICSKEGGESHLVPETPVSKWDTATPSRCRHFERENSDSKSKNHHCDGDIDADDPSILENTLNLSNPAQRRNEKGSPAFDPAGGHLSAWSAARVRAMKRAADRAAACTSSKAGTEKLEDEATYKKLAAGAADRLKSTVVASLAKSSILDDEGRLKADILNLREEKTDAEQRLEATNAEKEHLHRELSRARIRNKTLESWIESTQERFDSSRVALEQKVESLQDFLQASQDARMKRMEELRSSMEERNRGVDQLVSEIDSVIDQRCILEKLTLDLNEAARESNFNASKAALDGAIEAGKLLLQENIALKETSEELERTLLLRVEEADSSEALIQSLRTELACARADADAANRDLLESSRRYTQDAESVRMQAEADAKMLQEALEKRISQEREAASKLNEEWKREFVEKLESEKRHEMKVLKEATQEELREELEARHEENVELLKKSLNEEHAIALEEMRDELLQTHSKAEAALREWLKREAESKLTLELGSARLHWEKEAQNLALEHQVRLSQLQSEAQSNIWELGERARAAESEIRMLDENLRDAHKVNYELKLSLDGALEADRILKNQMQAATKAADRTHAEHLERIAELEETLELRVREAERVQASLNRVKNELNEATRASELLQERTAFFEEDAQQVASGLELRATEAETERKKVEEENRDLKKLMESLRLQNSQNLLELTSEKNAALDAGKILHGELLAAQSKARHLNGRIEDLERILALRIEESEASEIHAMEQVEELLVELKAARESERTLKGIVDKGASESASKEQNLEILCQELRSEANAAKETIKTLISERDASFEAAKMLTTELERIKVELDEAEKLKKLSVFEESALRRRGEVLKRELLESEQMARNIKRELQDAHEKLNETQSETASQLVDLRRHHIAHQSHLEASLGAANREIEALTEALSCSEKERQKLMNDFDEAVVERDGAQEAAKSLLEQSKATNTRAMGERQELESILAFRIQEVEVAEERCASLKNQLAVAEEKANRLQKENRVALANEAREKVNITAVEEDGALEAARLLMAQNEQLKERIRILEKLKVDADSTAATMHQHHETIAHALYIQLEERNLKIQGFQDEQQAELRAVKEENEKALEERERTISRLKLKLETVEREREEQNVTLLSLRAALDEQKSEVDAREQTLAALKVGLEESLVITTEEAMTLKAQLIRLQDEFMQASDEIKGLKASHAAVAEEAQLQAQRLKEEHKRELENRLHDDDRRLKRLNTDLRSRIEELEQIAEQAAQADAKYLELQQELVNAKKKPVDAEETKEALAAILQEKLEADARIESLESQLEARRAGHGHNDDNDDGEEGGDSDDGEHLEEELEAAREEAQNQAYMRAILQGRYEFQIMELKAQLKEHGILHSQSDARWSSSRSSSSSSFHQKDALASAVAPAAASPKHLSSPPPLPLLPPPLSPYEGRPALITAPKSAPSLASQEKGNSKNNVRETRALARLSELSSGDLSAIVNEISKPYAEECAPTTAFVDTTTSASDSTAVASQETEKKSKPKPRNNGNDNREGLSLIRLAELKTADLSAFDEAAATTDAAVPLTEGARDGLTSENSQRQMEEEEAAIQVTSPRSAKKNRAPFVDTTTKAREKNEGDAVNSREKEKESQSKSNYTRNSNREDRAFMRLSELNSADVSAIVEAAATTGAVGNLAEDVGDELTSESPQCSLKEEKGEEEAAIQVTSPRSAKKSGKSHKKSDSFFRRNVRGKSRRLPDGS